MRYSLFVGLLLAGVGSQLFARSESSFPSLTVTVLVQFDQPFAPPVYDTLRSEVEQIFNDTNVSFDWLLYRTGDSTPVMERVVVVRIRGLCHASGLTGIERPECDSPLGFTHSVDRQLLPFVEVSCDHVRALTFLRRLPQLQPAAIVFGRALGRVLAHEIYHVLAETTEHAEDGVARSHLTCSDLTCPYLGFDKQSLRKLTLTIQKRHRQLAPEPAMRAGF
jgi:hypothetical protein